MNSGRVKPFQKILEKIQGEGTFLWGVGRHIKMPEDPG